MIAKISVFAAHPCRVAALAVAAVMLAAASPASAVEEITSLDRVAIRGGSLVVIGTTRLAGSTVVLDNGVATAVSDPDGNFTFQVAYLPPNCMIELAVGAVIRTAVVARCGPRGLNPRGAWQREDEYLIDDVATFAGSSWRAIRDNSGRRPDKALRHWEQFVAKGDAGPRGQQGAQGLKGNTGDQGAAGPQGLEGDTGNAGATGPQGAQGTAGVQGSAGAQGPQGDIGAAGAQGVAGVQGLQGDTGPKGDKGLVWRGAWDNATAYATDDAVIHQGSAYIALQDGTGQAPETQPTYWSLLVEKGDTGAKGDTGNAGATGPQGAQGTAGATGATGPTGATGASGPAGATGAQGPAGPNSVANGTVGAPSINFASNTSTGIFSPENGKIAMTTGGLLFLHNIGGENTALGREALSNNSGIENTALGYRALMSNTTGSANIAIGNFAGFNPTAPSNSIFIGNTGAAADTNTIKIGTQGTQLRTFIGGIRGRVTGVNDAIAVGIDSNGQLGVASSSRRYKQDIQPMGDVSAVLQKLRPVTFRYKKPYADGGKPIQYGLIAEEVAEELPDLAVFNKDGQPETVKYHLLSTFLLAAYQRQQRIIETQAETVAALERRLSALEAGLAQPDTRQAAAQPH